MFTTDIFRACCLLLQRKWTTTRRNGLSITLWLPATRVVTLARSLPRAYRLPIPQHAPFAIGYTFENNPHHYLPDFVGTLADGTPFLAEAGMEDDKRGDRNLAKAEAARRLACLQQGTFWIGTERRVGVHGIPTTGRKG